MTLHKIVTFSLDHPTITKLEKLTTWRHQNKSAILRKLIETEYNRQLEIREEAAAI
jgi:predicted transcriptional regulator